MPQLGTLDVAPLLAGAPEMKDLHTDELLLPSVEILHALHEIEAAPMLDILPPALHPTVPPTIQVTVWRARGTELGDFTMVQVRIGCRAGVRPRGFLLGCVIDDDVAAEQLGARWGFRSDPGTPVLKSGHDRIQCVVERDGDAILDLSLVGPEPISGGDVQYTANMNLARTPAGERLVQVDPEFEFTKASRGRLQLTTFDAAAWGEARIVPSWPVSTSFTVANVTMPRIRYTCKVDVPAMVGTETVRPAV